MKKFLIGTAIASFGIFGVAMAKQTPVEVVNTGIVLISYSDNGKIAKYYDYDNGVVCYLTQSRNFSSVFESNGVAITCIK